jgi:hypothetical protein
MTATRLMAEINSLGIRLEAKGDRLRFSPRSAVTPDLAERMKAHKAELLVVLRTTRKPPQSNLGLRVEWEQYGVWIERLGDDGTVSLIHPEYADDDLHGIEPPAPCPRCGKLELWETLAGSWRCLRCDPPATAHRIRKRAAMLRSFYAGSPRVSGEEG